VIFRANVPWERLNYPTWTDIYKIIFFVRKIGVVLVVSDFVDPQLVTTGIFLRLAASENDDLRLQHQAEYFNSLLEVESALQFDRDILSIVGKL
jgi:hypothetical protein